MSNKADEVLGIIGEKLLGAREEDEYDLFGKIVANKLRTVADEQRKIAEKLINDVLYDAEFGHLEYNSRVINSIYI